MEMPLFCRLRADQTCALGFLAALLIQHMMAIAM